MKFATAFALIGSAAAAIAPAGLRNAVVADFNGATTSEESSFDLGSLQGPIVQAGPANVQPVAGVTPPSVTIRSITYGGTGCPQGSVGSFISADKTTYTLIFDSYVANVGPGSSITASRKNCQILVDFIYPQGYQFSILEQNVRGFAALDAGVTGLQKSTWYFSGSSAQASSQTSFRGPISKDYLATDQIPLSSQIYSPCGGEGPLNLNTQVRVENRGNPNGQGQLTTDSIDGKVSLKFAFSWRRC